MYVLSIDLSILLLRSASLVDSQPHRYNVGFARRGSEQGACSDRSEISPDVLGPARDRHDLRIGSNRLVGSCSSLVVGLVKRLRRTQCAGRTRQHLGRTRHLLDRMTCNSIVNMWENSYNRHYNYLPK